MSSGGREDAGPTRPDGVPTSPTGVTKGGPTPVRKGLVGCAGMALALGVLVVLGWLAANRSPHIVSDLSAAAPSGAQVSVEHIGKPVIDMAATQPRWNILVASKDTPAAVATYRSWFESRGFTVIDASDSNTPAGEKWLYACNAALIWVRQEAPQVTITINESEIDSGGSLVSPQPCDQNR